MPEKYTIAIPMAGFGSRMRPQTWSKPKSLIQLADKYVLDHVIDQFNSLPGVENAEWVFIVGPNQGAPVAEHMRLYHPAKKVSFVVQEIMKGQSDALYLAREHLHGHMLMSFTDTLIETDLSFLPSVQHDGVAFVKAVPDPRRFGVAEVDKDGWVTRFVEKPQEMQNNRVVVGFYYFKSAEALLSAIEEQVQRNIALKGEFFLTDTINVMLEKGAKFNTHSVEVWLDAGTRDILLQTNRHLLEHGHANTVKREGVTIIPPVFIPEDAIITNSTIGPHASIGHNSEIHDSTIAESIIEAKTKLYGCNLTHSHIGRDSFVKGAKGTLNLGDTSWVDL